MNKHKAKYGAKQGHREFSLKPSAPLTKAPRIEFQLFRTALSSLGINLAPGLPLSQHQALTILLVTDPLFLRDWEGRRQIKCNYRCLFCILHQTQHICGLETHLYHLKQQPDFFLSAYYFIPVACVVRQRWHELFFKEFITHFEQMLACNTHTHTYTTELCMLKKMETEMQMLLYLQVT